MDTPRIGLADRGQRPRLSAHARACFAPQIFQVGPGAHVAQFAYFYCGTILGEALQDRRTARPPVLHRRLLFGLIEGYTFREEDPGTAAVDMGVA